MYVNRNYDKTRELLKEVAKKNKAQVTTNEIDSIIFEFESMDSEIEYDYKDQTNVNNDGSN